MKTSGMGSRQIAASIFWLSSRNFFRGAKSIVMQISFVMLLFSDQILGRGKSFLGGQTVSGAPPCGRKPVLSAQSDTAKKYS